MSKQLGDISSVTLWLTEPVPMNFDTIEFNKLTLLCGTNGVGKSFILVLNWFLSYLGNIIVMSGMKADPTAVGQFISDNCFNGRMQGIVKCLFSSGITIDVAWDNGKVMNVTHNGLDTITEPVQVKFMSSAYRTFSAINGYLFARKQFAGKSDEEIVSNMISSFRLYDIMYIEHLIRKCPLILTPELKKSLEGFDIKDIHSLHVDLNECDFYTEDDKGNKKSMSRWYGSGHQALINMIIGAS